MRPDDGRVIATVRDWLVRFCFLARSFLSADELSWVLVCGARLREPKRVFWIYRAITAIRGRFVFRVHTSNPTSLVSPCSHRGGVSLSLPTPANDVTRAIQRATPGDTWSRRVDSLFHSCTAIVPLPVRQTIAINSRKSHDEWHRAAFVTST